MLGTRCTFEQQYKTMSALALRNELAELIAKEKNASLLEVLKEILTGSSKNALLKAKLTARALKAEEDLTAGRVLTTDQVRARLASRKKK